MTIKNNKSFPSIAKTFSLRGVFVIPATISGLILLLFRISAMGQTDLSITSVQPDFLDSQTVTIRGTGFGVKPVATPLLFDDFDQGVEGSPISGQAASHFGSWLSLKWKTAPVYSKESSRIPGSLSSKHAMRAPSTANGSLLQFNYPPGFNEAYLDFWINTSFGNISDPELQRKTWRIGYYTNKDNGGPGIAMSGWRLQTDKFSLIWNLSGSEGPTFGLTDKLREGIWEHIQVVLSRRSDNTGTVRYIVNGRRIIDQRGNIQTLAQTETLPWNAVLFGFYIANYADTDPSHGLDEYIDDVYIDNSWARVEIGDAASYDSCTHREIQIPVSWTDTRIEVNANYGSFASGQSAYLYVTDASGRVNASGYRVTLGAGSPISPKGLRVTK